MHIPNGFPRIVGKRLAADWLRMETLARDGRSVRCYVQSWADRDTLTVTIYHGVPAQDPLEQMEVYTMADAMALYQSELDGITVA